MANHRKDSAEHVAAGTWRADEHAHRAPQYVPDETHDLRLWQLLDHWQAVFDEARADVEASGVKIQSATQTVTNPACNVMKDASLQIRELCKVLGIGALNRARLGAGSTGDGDGDDTINLAPLPERGKRASAKR